MKLTSSAFTHQTNIPTRYTCDGKNVSPPLNWTEIPPFAQSLVLIMDDPDAPGGIWDHWIVFNLPVNLTSLPERAKQFPIGTKFGKNSWGKLDYGGPCPPDRQHRYFFKLYALNTVLDLPTGATKTQIQQAMKGKLIKETELIGLYVRPGQK